MKLFNIFKKRPPPEKEEEIYGIDIDNSHARARALVPEEFFWDCASDVAPFGSDEGDTALAEFRQWRQENPNHSVKDCLVWTIEGVGEMEFTDYSESILKKELIQEQIEDDEFDDQQYIFTLDVSVVVKTETGASLLFVL